MKFSTVWDMEYWMGKNGLACGLNTPEALVSKEEEGEEVGHRLPPYAKRKAFLVDEYKLCPSNWMKSEGKLISYFAAIKEGNGMWLDFNKCWENKYDVAIVVSVQGINPITGLPCNDAQLEQYIEECPKCKEKFGLNRLCKKCGYIWPKQNYICTTGTPYGNLWLDGFRAADGMVRQYILTQEKLRGVASNIIGEDRVYAIGVSFFLSKKEKANHGNNKELTGFYSFINYGHQPQFFSPVHTTINWQAHSTTDTTKGIINKRRSKSIATTNKKLSETATDPSLTLTCYHAIDLTNCDYTRSIETEKVEVGAGANINQIVYDDPETLDFWRAEPESIICINYCVETDCNKIVSGDKINIKGNKEGFLKAVPVGN